MSRVPVLGSLLITAITALAVPTATAAQSTSEADAIRSVGHTALDAISREDHEALAALFIDGGTLVAMPPGGGAPRVTTRAQVATTPFTEDYVERGWDGRVEVLGAVATLSLPYDFYRSGAWSHCGVDVFTLALTPDGWRIASLVYTVEQPPVCSRHPDGPPGD